MDPEASGLSPAAASARCAGIRHPARACSGLLRGTPAAPPCARVRRPSTTSVARRRRVLRLQPVPAASPGAAAVLRQPGRKAWRPSCFAAASRRRTRHRSDRARRPTASRPWPRQRATTKLRNLPANRLADAPCSNQGSASLTTSSTKRTSSRRRSSPRSCARCVMLVSVCAPIRSLSVISFAMISNSTRYSGGASGGAWQASWMRAIDCWTPPAASMRCGACGAGCAGAAC